MRVGWLGGREGSKRRRQIATVGGVCVPAPGGGAHYPSADFGVMAQTEPSVLAASYGPRSPRRLSPAAKLAIAQQLRQTAWELTAAGVRARHPQLSAEAIRERVRAIFLRAVG